MQLRNAGVEFAKLKEKLDEHAKHEIKKAGYIAGGLAVPATGLFLLRTNRGRKLLAKGLTNFRPLYPLAAATTEARVKMHNFLAKKADHWEELAHRGWENINNKGWDYFLGQSMERGFRKNARLATRTGASGYRMLDEKTVPIPKDQYITSNPSLADYQSDSHVMPGLIDRIRQKWWNNVVYPTLAHPTKEMDAQTGIRGFAYRWLQRPIASRARLTLQERAFDPDTSPLMATQRSKKAIQNLRKVMFSPSREGGGIAGSANFSRRRHGSLKSLKVSEQQEMLTRVFNTKLKAMQKAEGQLSPVLKAVRARPPLDPILIARDKVDQILRNAAIRRAGGQPAAVLRRRMAATAKPTGHSIAIRKGTSPLVAGLNQRLRAKAAAYTGKVESLLPRPASIPPSPPMSDMSKAPLLTREAHDLEVARWKKDTADLAVNPEKFTPDIRRVPAVKAVPVQDEYTQLLKNKASLAPRWKERLKQLDIERKAASKAAASVRALPKKAPTTPKVRPLVRYDLQPSTVFSLKENTARLAALDKKLAIADVAYSTSSVKSQAGKRSELKLMELQAQRKRLLAEMRGPEPRVSHRPDMPDENVGGLDNEETHKKP